MVVTALPAYRLAAQVVPPALAIAADSTAPLVSRAAALRSLRGVCARETVPVLVTLGQPYRHPWVVWRGALAALADCDRPELATFWRELMTFPRRPVRELAIVGLARTGEAADRELLAEATHRETDPAMRRLAAWADSLLGLERARRRGAAAP